MTRAATGVGILTPSSGASVRSKAQDTASTVTSIASNYIPHVSDLVYPIRDAFNLSDKNIPSVYLEAEAVDSSILLGHGASFTASLLKLPPGPKTIEVTTHIPDGFSMTTSRPAPLRPSYVVYKTARIAFGANGEPLPQYRKSMLSVLTEFHALVHPILFKHANVIDFLGVAWGSNPFSSMHRLPALIVEFAEHGTLAQALSVEKNLDPHLKDLICLDIARGLSALHQVGLVHGDIKAENILVCSSPDRKYTAKISDFGFSIVAATENNQVWMGGTDPWRAPEIELGSIQIDLAIKTDIYSFGLLAWVIVLNGGNPFDFIGDVPVQKEKIEAIKQDGCLVHKAKGKKWLLRYLKARLVASIMPSYEEIAALVSVQQGWSPEVMGMLSIIRGKMTEKLGPASQQSRLLENLDDIFECCLGSDPLSRELDVVLKALDSSLDGEGGGKYREAGDVDLVGKITSKEKDVDTKPTDSARHHGSANTLDLTFWSERGYMHRWFSWQKTRDLEPSVQNFIFNFLYSSNNADKGPELFLLCSYYMNGYGCRSDPNEALRTLQQAATLGHHVSRALLYRIWQACRPDEDNPGLPYLEGYAQAGARAALEDIEKALPQTTMESIRRWVRNAGCGVGANWLSTPEMLEGRSQIEWIQDDWLMKRARDATIPLSDIKVNKRGDSILHFVSMCGMWKEFKSLILDHNMDINLRNPHGETPLLCGCRAGQGAIVIYCLTVFNADASIAAYNGETPLHWLIHFGDESIEAIVKDMIKRGANVDAASRERLSYSYYPASIDIDWRMPGTPLAWAIQDNRPHIVRTLLRYGADPNFVSKEAIGSPLETAAHYHHHECLRIMIEFLESNPTRTMSDGQIHRQNFVLYGPIVKQAEGAADKFSMILRSGADYLERLYCTLDLLREKTRDGDFESQMQGSMLYTAVSKAHDEVVEYLFQKKWLVGTINTPIGEAQRTPVLEAIRWNRETLVETLMDHGADILARAANPFAPEELNWSALHIFAHEGHDGDLTLVETLVHSKFPVGGWVSREGPTSNTLPDISTLSFHDQDGLTQRNETPFAVAVRHNAFNLASKLLSLAADPNSLSITAGLFASLYPLTVLGHVIVANARFCHARLNYLLQLSKPPVNFLVEPSRRLTALHRCAMAYQDISKRADGEQVPSAEFDMDTNADIMYELLMKWRKAQELDASCSINGNTALHLAVLARNSGAVKALVEAGASTSITNEEGKTALGIAEDTTAGQEIQSFLAKWG
ncbi:MAG: hypothetical protein Q9196_002853 [Gyalolechia fulgens]